MTDKERESMIEDIKANDSTYNYNAVNFKYYSDEDLLILKSKLIRDTEVQAKLAEGGRQD